MGLKNMFLFRGGGGGAARRSSSETSLVTPPRKEQRRNGVGRGSNNRNNKSNTKQGQQNDRNDNNRARMRSGSDRQLGGRNIQQHYDDDEDDDEGRISLGSLPQQLNMIRRRRVSSATDVDDDDNDDGFDDDVSSIHVGESVYSPLPRASDGGDAKSKSELNHVLVSPTPTPPPTSATVTTTTTVTTTPKQRQPCLVDLDDEDDNDNDEDDDNATSRKLVFRTPTTTTGTLTHTNTTVSPSSSSSLPQQQQQQQQPDSLSSWLDDSKAAMERLLSFGSEHSKSVMDQIFGTTAGGSDSMHNNNNHDNSIDNDTATIFLPAGGEVSSIASHPSSFASTAGTNHTERAGNVTKKKDVLCTPFCLSLLECSTWTSSSTSGTCDNNNNLIHDIHEAINTASNQTQQQSDIDTDNNDRRKSRRDKTPCYSSVPERMVRESLRRHVELFYMAGEASDGSVRFVPSMSTTTARQHQAPQQQPTYYSPTLEPARPIQKRRQNKSLPVSVDDDLLEVDDHVKISNYAEQCLIRHEYHEAIEIYRMLWKKQRGGGGCGSGSGSDSGDDTSTHKNKRSKKNDKNGHHRPVGDATSVANTLTKLAVLNLLVGRLELAMKYSKAALNIYRQDSRPGRIAMSLMQVGMIYFAANRLGPALKAWREALHMIYKAMGYDNTNVPILLNNIGCLHMEAGDLTSSLKTLEEALDLQRTALSSFTSDTNVSLLQMATTMGNIAMASAKRLEMEVAMSLLEEARALQESVLPSELHPLIQLTTNTLDRIMEMREGTLANAPAATFALHLFGRQQSLIEGDAVKKTFSSDVEDDSSRNVQAFETSSFSSASYPLQRMDSGINNRAASVFGNGDGIPMRRGSSKSVTTTMTATDNVDFLLLGPLAAELTLEQRVRETILAGFGKSLSDDEKQRRLSRVPYLSGSRRRLRIPVDIDGVVLDAELHLQGINAQALEHLDHDEVDEALDLFESALRSHREKYGQVHHLVGSALHNIGIVHLFAGRFSVAQTHFQEAASVRTAALGPEHPDVAASMLKISLILMATGDLQGANATLLHILQSLKSSLGSSNHPQVAKVLNNLGVVEYEMGAIQKAFKSLEEAHDIQCRLGLGLRSRYFPQRHEFAELAVANNLCNIGFVYAKQGKFADAARMYQEAFRLQSKYLHAQHPTLQRTAENVDFVQSRVLEQRSSNVIWQAFTAGVMPLFQSCGGNLRSIGYAA